MVIIDRGESLHLLSEKSRASGRESVQSESPLLKHQWDKADSEHA